MKPEELKIRHFGSELKYSASRSSGPGGQNVNKVNTKVELRLSVISTLNLSEKEKELVFRKLKKRINNDGELVIVAQDGRTQAENKLIVTERFFELLAKALTVRPSRKATRPTLSSKIKRLEKKRSRSNVKKLRSSGIPTDET